MNSRPWTILTTLFPLVYSKQVNCWCYEKWLWKFFENLSVCCLGKVVRRGGGLYASHTFQSLSTLIPIERKILCQMNTHYILLPSSRCFSSTELFYRLEHGANCSEGQLTGKTLTPFEAQGRLRNSREFIPLLVCLQLGPSFSWRVTHISIERLSWFVTVVIYGCESWNCEESWVPKNYKFSFGFSLPLHWNHLFWRPLRSKIMWLLCC